MNKICFFLLVSILIITFSACKKDNDDLSKEKLAREKYIENNKITTKPYASGLYVVPVRSGAGDAVDSGKTVTVSYTGYYIDKTSYVLSTPFDIATRTQPFKFKVGDGKVIKGWDEGLAKMNEGDQALLIIPSEIGYGGVNYNPIPAYSTLVFDITVLKVE